MSSTGEALSKFSADDPRGARAVSTLGVVGPELGGSRIPSTTGDKSCISIPSSFNRRVIFGVHQKRNFHNVQRHATITIRQFAPSRSSLEPVELFDQHLHAEDRRSHVCDPQLLSCVPVHYGACHPWPVPDESLMGSSPGTHVHLHHCQPEVVRFVNSVRSRQVSRMSLRSRHTNEFDSLLQLLGLLQLKVCFLDPSSASSTWLSYVTTCHNTVFKTRPFALKSAQILLMFDPHRENISIHDLFVGKRLVLLEGFLHIFLVRVGQIAPKLSLKLPSLGFLTPFVSSGKGGFSLSAVFGSEANTEFLDLEQNF